jgi:hypothetical protein
MKNQLNIFRSCEKFVVVVITSMSPSLPLAPPSSRQPLDYEVEAKDNVKRQTSLYTFLYQLHSNFY